MNVKVKQKIPLKIKRMGINGEGIGFYKKTLVFVPGALKGEDIFCQITSVKKNFAEAKLLSVNKASKFRVTPMCDIYETCGGCQIMHLKYDKQLEFKTDLFGFYFFRRANGYLLLNFRKVELRDGMEMLL